MGAISLTHVQWRYIKSPELAYVMLAAFMNVYIFVWPATFKIGWEEARAEQLKQVEMVPVEYWTGLERSPWLRWVHTFPVALWLVLSVAQFLALELGFLKIHRLLGRVFGLTALVIWIGLWFMIIENEGLFIPLLGRACTSFFNFMFGLTAAVAWSRARQRQIASHQRWIKRHLWLGMSPVIQRLFHAAAFYTLQALHFEVSTLGLFLASALICFGATPVLCELGLHFSTKPQQKSE